MSMINEGASKVSSIKDNQRINKNLKYDDETKSLIGKQSLSTSHLADWKNPLQQLKELDLFKPNILTFMKNSQYDHNVIIQIGADEKIAGYVGILMSKHPDKTTVIQFDVASLQWKVLQGDLDKPMSGKIRWIIAGNGDYTATNRETLFEKNNAEQFTNGIIYIKNKVLEYYQPDKIVLFGNELARGGVNENFALKTCLSLGKQQINIPLVSYNRQVAMEESGIKLIGPLDSPEVFKLTQEHRFVFFFDYNSQQMSINDKPAILHFINEVKRGELKIWQLLKDENSGIMDLFRNPNNENIIDIDFIKKVAFNQKAYRLFIDELRFNHHADYNKIFYKRLSILFEIYAIKETPLWLMVEPSNIQKNNPTHVEDNDSNVTVIIRSGDGEKGRLQAEKLAAAQPDNILIVQLDPNSKKMMVEYGDIKKLAKRPFQRWILINNNDQKSDFKYNYADGLAILKQRYNLNDPTTILYYFTDEKQNLELADKESFIVELSTQLNKNKITYEEIRLPIGTQSPQTNNIDSWVNPLDMLKVLSPDLSQGEWSITASSYDHNVVVQVGFDNITASSAAKFMTRYSKKTTVIQFSMVSHQWKVIFGDLDFKMQGKIRWIISGHGHYAENNPKNFFETSNADEFVTGMLYLKNNVLTHYPPEKMVLVGCNLARGGVNDSFALQVSIGLGKQGMNIPLVSYDRKVAVVNNGHKIVKPFDNLYYYAKAKQHRLVFVYNPVSKRTYINDQPAIIYFINQVRDGELKIGKLLEDNHSGVMDLFRNADNENKIDIYLLKKAVFNQQAYQLFINELKNYNSMLDNTFHQRLSQVLADANITEAPLWSMVNTANIQKSTASLSSADTLNLTVIIRTSSSEKGKVKAEKLASVQPDNTLVIQYDLDTQVTIVEYGDINKLAKLSRQKWILIDDLHVGVGESQLVASRLTELKNRYGFNTPSDVLLYLTYNDDDLELIIKKKFAHKLLTHLEDCGISTDVSLGENLAIESNIAQQPTRNNAAMMTLVTMQPKEINNKIAMLLESIALGKQTASKLNLDEHVYLMPYFARPDGQLDINKINIAVYDPIVSGKISHFFSSDNLGSQDKWNSLFTTQQSTTLKHQAIETKQVLAFLSLQPEKITCLGGVSTERLIALFPSEYGFHHAKVLALANDQQQLMLYNTQVDQLVMAYSENKKPFIGDSLGQALQRNADINNQQLKNYDQLSKLTQNGALEIRINTLELPLYYGKSIHHIYSLIAPDKLGAQPDGLKQFLLTLGHLKQKQALDILSPPERRTLERYNHLYRRKLAVLDSMGSTTKNQSIIQSLQALENNQLVYLKSKSETYTLLSYSSHSQYHLKIINSHGIEVKISHQDFNQARKQLSDLFSQYMSQKIHQSDGTMQSRGQIAGFQNDSRDPLRGTVQKINTQSEMYRSFYQATINELQFIHHNNNVRLIDEKASMIVGGQTMTVRSLQQLGAMIDDIPLNSQHINQQDWQNRLKFEANLLSSNLTVMEGNATDAKLLRMLKHLLANHSVEQRVATGGTLQQRAVLKQQFKLLKKSNLDENTVPLKTVNELRQTGIKLPIYARVSNRVGQGVGGLGMFMSINSIYQLVDALDNPNLSEESRAEIEKNLFLTCASAYFNYGDMVLQPILLKLAYKQAGSFNAVSSLPARVTIIFNFIGMGLDIYQACDAFEQLEKTNDPKLRQDLIVTGTLSIANAFIGGITVVGIFVASSTLPVIGLFVGALLLVGGMIYSGVRAVEQIEELLGEELSWQESAREGTRAAFGFEPSDNILNRISYKQHVTYFKHRNWQQDLDVFKVSYLYQGFEEHLQFVEKPILVVENKYYIRHYGSSEIIKSVFFNQQHEYSPLADIDVDDSGPSFTEAQINYIRKNYFYDSTVQKWYRSTGNMEALFNNKFRLKQKTAPLSYQEICRESVDDILVLNLGYQSELLTQFVQTYDLNDAYSSKKNKDITLQIKELSTDELRLFRTKNHHENHYHSDFVENIDISQLGNEYLNQRSEIAEKILSENPEIIYEGMINIGNKHEDKTILRNISYNSGGGNDIIIGKKKAKNAFNYTMGNKFFAGGDFNDIINVSLTEYLLEPQVTQLAVEANGGDNTLMIKDIPNDSRMKIDLNSLTSVIQLNKNKRKNLYLRDVNNVMLSGNRNSDCQLIGNQQNNILDAGTSNAFVSGGLGDDQIVFESGIANGGAGNDRYYLRRFDWDNYFIDNHANNYQLYFTAMINEQEPQLSDVNLGYSLNEIEKAVVIDNDLFIVAKARPEITSKYSVQINLVLKNVYTLQHDERVVNHQYRLRTRDGFILTSQLKNSDKKGSHVINEGIFEIAYHQDSDSLRKEIDKPVVINQNLNTITFGQQRFYQKPVWGKFNFIGSMSNLKYQGSQQDDRLLMVNRHSRIMVSKGKDVYQISPEQYVQGRVVFDFTKIAGTYTEDDRVVIALPSENGYQLQAQEQSIYLKNQLGDKKLMIDFINYDSSMVKSVMIQDANSHHFQVELTPQGHKIHTEKNISLSTNYNDHIKLPVGYIYPTAIIDSQAGDDIIENNSGEGYLINAGDGNDIITATTGYNVLYGGGGDNFIYGGNQSDLMLSDLGNDRLYGDAGDDIYIVTGSTFDGVIDSTGDSAVATKETLIIDEQGINNVHLINFYKQYNEEIKEGTTFHLYRSLFSQRTVKIKLPLPSESNQIKVHHYDALPKHLPSSCYTEMSYLVRYLGEQKYSAKQLNPLLPWQPIDEFKGALLGSNFIPLDMSANEIYLAENKYSRQLVIKIVKQEQKLWDNSGQGRVLISQAQKGALSATKNNNVLYSDRGENNLYGGEGNDVIISNGNNGMLNDSGGKNIFIINGDKKGGSYIRSFGGENTVHLVNFKPLAYREKPDHLDNSTRYIYQSENGHTVKIYQYPNTHAPTIIHHESLSGIDGSTSEQTLEFLVNTLASMRMQDERNSIGSHSASNSTIEWDPTGYVESFIKRVS